MKLIKYSVYKILGRHGERRTSMSVKQSLDRIGSHDATLFFYDLLDRVMIKPQL